MKTVMVLGAAIGQVPLIQKIRGMGFRAVAVSCAGDYPGFTAADEYAIADILDKQAVLEIARQKSVCGIVFDQSEIGVRTAAWVCEQLGLACMPYATACLFTDKALTYERCRRLGIPSPEQYAVQTLQEAIEAAHKIGLPVMIKPADSSGSCGVHLVSKSSEAASAFSDAMRFSVSKTVLVQEYVRGQEIVSGGLVSNNQVATIAVGRRENFRVKNPYIFSATYFPGQVATSVADRIAAWNERLYKDAGIAAAMFQAEYIVQPEGRIVLIDAAARGGGAFLSSHVIPLATGFDLHAAYIQAACGQAVALPDKTAYCSAAGYVCFLLPKGKIVHVSGLDAIASMPGVAYHSVNGLAVGKETQEPTDKRFRCGPIVLCGKTQADLDAARNRLKQTIDVQVQTERGIEGPIWE